MFLGAEEHISVSWVVEEHISVFLGLGEEAEHISVSLGMGVEEHISVSLGLGERSLGG